MVPIAKNIKRYFSLQEFVVVFVAIALSITAGASVFVLLKREVAINDNGVQIVAKTMKTTVKEVLDQNGIEVGPDDYISQPLDSKLQRISRNQINIKRAVPITVFVDGEELNIMTYRDTVKETLDSKQIELSDSDIIEGAGLGDSIVKDMQVKIIRVTENTVSEDISIPYNVLSRENVHMDKGTEKVVTEGKEGTEQKTYNVVLHDGKEVARDLVQDVVLANPIDKLVEYGTLLTYKPARGDTFRYTQVLEMRASAYTASLADPSKGSDHPGYGITSTGARASKGVIAVDPRVIPLGTRVYIEVAGNTPDYGIAVAADTGGAIKNDLIDLCFDDEYTALTWGVKKVKVYFLTE